MQVEILKAGNGILGSKRNDLGALRFSRKYY